jgi:hypothetical protein
MDSNKQLAGVDVTGGSDRDPAASNAAFAGLVETATVEFLSSLQLLAERARFLTGAAGAAIALKEGGKFLYRASAGSSAMTGSPVATRHAPIANCLGTAKASIVSAHTSGGPLAHAAVPVVRQQEVAGFFELSATRSSFSNEDMLVISGLAEMVNTALDHLEAAENARESIFEVKPEAPSAVTPLHWHAAPQPEPSIKADAASAAVPESLNVQACQSCGFPVSDGRKLCVECEQKPGAVPVSEPQLLAIEKEQSWISSHGYTIASLLVTALVAAIIFWLR